MKNVILLLLSLVVSGCATRVDVTTTTEPGIDFSRFDTFALVPPPEARTRVRDLLEVEITQELEEKGYRPAPIDDTDLLVVFQGSTEASQRKVFAESPGGCCVIETYIAGTLMIDVFDPRSSERIWRGVGKVDLERESDIERAASDAADAVLAKFPGPE